MNALTPYPSYKDSGVEWLGDVPEHWTLHRLKDFLREVDQRSTTGAEELLSVSHLTGVTPRSEKNITMFKAESYIGSKLCQSGDIVANTMWLWMGAIGTAHRSGIVSPSYAVYRPCSTDTLLLNFLDLLLRSRIYVGVYHRESTGLRASRLRLYPEQFLRLKLVLPPLDEQRAIADFLDGMDARITRFLAARRKMIALLEEQKQAVINQAVTRGLDTDVPLKDSGVDWLGEIPVHWVVRRLSNLIDLTTGFPFKSEAFSANSDDIPLLRGINIEPGALRWKTVVYWPREEANSFSSFALMPGDIVLGMDRPMISSGVRVAVICEDDVPSLLLQRVARIRPGDTLLSRYLYRLFAGQGFSNYMEPIFTGISVPHLSPEQIRGFRIPLPPIEEQPKIIDHIDHETSRIDALIGRHRREIDLMQEYRTRLISDVVTGKLDVRGVDLPPVETVVGEEMEEDPVTA